MGQHDVVQIGRDEEGGFALTYQVIHLLDRLAERQGMKGDIPDPVRIR
jgi:hypothetical protein